MSGKQSEESIKSANQTNYTRKAALPNCCAVELAVCVQHGVLLANPVTE